MCPGGPGGSFSQVEGALFTGSWDEFKLRGVVDLFQGAEKNSRTCCRTSLTTELFRCPFPRSFDELQVQVRADPIYKGTLVTPSLNIRALSLSYDTFNITYKVLVIGAGVTKSLLFWFSGYGTFDGKHAVKDFGVLVSALNHEDQSPEIQIIDA